MNIIRIPEDKAPYNIVNPVITIGTFDGVHLGHQKILQKVNDWAAEVNGESVVLTFDLHPRQVLRPGSSISLLSSLEEKIDLLKQYDIDHVVVVEFTHEFARQTPEAYITDFLFNKFKPAKVVVGYDHKFGRNRAGDTKFMEKMGDRLGFEVEEISARQVQDITISSTRIREALMEGNVERANELLGHCFTLSGKVVQGNQLGRTIGYPTANIALKEIHKTIPVDGVYAVNTVVNGNRYRGMLYIGPKPTLDGKSKVIEVNIFDFDADIYKQDIVVELISKIRGDIKFSSLDLLGKQLEQDKIQTLEKLAQL